MSYQVINPFIQFVDPINGKPLSAGSVYFGRQDSDPKNQPANRINVYAVQDNGSEVLLAQPITLNGAGQPQYSGSVKQIKVELYSGETSYAIQVFNKNGAQKGYSPRVYSLVDIAGLASPSSDVSIAGVKAKDIARKYAEFPTVGDEDIVTLGFTAALQKALDDAPNNGTVFIPAGTWNCGTVTLPDKNISVVGVGATINATASRIFVRRKRGYFFGMSDIKFMGNGIAFDYDSNEASLPNHTQYFEYLINNCRFHNDTSAFALRLYGAREGLVSSCYFEGNKGVYTEFSINTVLDSCQWKNCGHMALSKLGSEGLIVSNAVALGCSFGIRAERTTGVQINNCMIDYCDSPIYLQGATDVLIQNNYISTRTANPAIHAVKYPDGFRGYNHLIAGNNIRDNHSATGSSCIRYEESDFVTITNNTLSNYASYAIVYTLLTQSTISCNTTINRSTLGTNSILALTDDSTVRVYENVVTQPISRAFTQSTWRNQGFTTENFGVATSGVGVTTFAINHNCSFTPANFNIKLTAGSEIPERFWVSATSATTFTVSFSAATAAARTICWEVTSAP